MKLIILDRDGVINEDSDDYIKSTDEFILLPGSLQAIAKLNKAGYTVAVATNQSGIARGYYDESTLFAMHEKLARLLAEHGGHIDYIAYCPHGPDDGCDCRKPQPGLLQQIAQHFAVDLTGVYVVGDTLRDLQAAEQMHAAPVLVKTGKGRRTLEMVQNDPSLNIEHVPVYNNLSEFVDALLEKQE